MPGVQSYHHGNLYAALLTAAEAELVEKGVEHFSLRGVARRAGVSHAAPAHHFGDVDGLLTALAALSFERLLQSMEAAAASAEPDPISNLVAIGIGYIDYAAGNPHLFSLLFASDRPDWNNPDLLRRADAAFAKLQSAVQAVADRHGRDSVAVGEMMQTAWAMPHGLATLFAMRRSRHFATLAPEEQRARFERILRAVAEAM